VNVPRRYAEPLRGYFESRALDLAEVPVDLRGTRFQLRVWNALRKIPPGTVRTYGSIAADVGAPRAMRAVGMANAHNPVPIVVPCHRVVEAGNRLGGFSAGVARKRWLLEHEGVRVLGDHVLPGQQELF
jgi:methylated-DNA-[protein]-cysteine S-methyltransferase